MQDLPVGVRYIAFAAVPVVIVLVLFAIFRGGDSSSPDDGATADRDGTGYVIDSDGGDIELPTYNPNPDADAPAATDDDDASGNDDGGSVANVGQSYAEDLRKGECIEPIDTDGYTSVLPCSEAPLKVLVVVEMPDSGWISDEYLKDAADEYCPDETDFKYWPDEFDWVLRGDRHILCLVRNPAGGSVGFDSTSLAGRWSTAVGYLDLGLDSVHENSDGQTGVYTFDEYGTNAFGLIRNTGSGEIIVYADGSAKISGTNDLLVFACFNDTYEGELNFTEDEFFGAIWCEGDPSDPGELRGYRQ